MNALAALMSDIDHTIERGSGLGRALTLSRITDLFLGGVGHFDEAHVELFDTVIERFAGVIEAEARAQLAERLAASPSGPRRVLRLLAHDEIRVARPVLTLSPRLDDQDLMAVAVARGRDHMLAICGRPHVAEMVTDVLVAHGDVAVHHAVVGNPGAQFSALSASALIARARADEGLQELLGDRRDLSEMHTRELIAIAKQTARRKLIASLPGAEAAAAEFPDQAVPQADLDVPAVGHGTAIAAVERLGETGFLTEAHIATFASEGRRAETMAALAYLTTLPLDYVERVLEEPDNELPIVIGRSRGWSWPTVRALLRLSDTSLNHSFWRAEEIFHSLPVSTAQRVVDFLHARQVLAGSGAPGRVTSVKAART